jgi:hypothetical protein
VDSRWCDLFLRPDRSGGQKALVKGLEKTDLRPAESTRAATIDICYSMSGINLSGAHRSIIVFVVVPMMAAMMAAMVVAAVVFPGIIRRAIVNTPVIIPGAGAVLAGHVKARNAAETDAEVLRFRVGRRKSNQP